MNNNEDQSKTNHFRIGITVLILAGCINLFEIPSTLVYARCEPPLCDIDNPDNDHDGLSTEDEIKIYHTNPNVPDTDHDGLLDGREVHTTHTNPLLADTDGEGLLDGPEVNGWFFSLDEYQGCKIPGVPAGVSACKDFWHTNPLKPDTDGDGCTDLEEKKIPSDPLNPSPQCHVANLPGVDNVFKTTSKNTPVTITLTGKSPQGYSLSFAIASQPNTGTLGAIKPTGPTSADVTYTPKPGFAGTVGFTYTASDGKRNSNPGTVTINMVK